MAELERNREDQRLIVGTSADTEPVPLRPFLAEPHPPIEWILGGLVAPGTIGMLIADGSVGKSHLCVQLCLELAAGHHPLGFRVERPTETLIVMAEGARAPFQNRVRLAAQSLGLSTDLQWFVQPKNFREFAIGGAALRALVESSGAKLVVLDTLGYFGLNDENDVNVWKERVMIPLREWAREFGATFLLVHHTRKGYKAHDGHPHRGTTGMYDDVDFYLLLDTVDGEGNGDKRDLWVRKNKYGRSGHRIPLRYESDRAIFVEELRA